MNFTLDISSDAFAVSIYSTPLTREEIAARRAAIAATPTLGQKVLLFTPPIFGLDLIAGMAAEAFTLATDGDPQEPWRDARGAIERDWSDSIFTQAFVAKVRQAGRELVQAEVAALERHLELETTLRSVAGTVGSAILGRFGIGV